MVETTKVESTSSPFKAALSEANPVNTGRKSNVHKTFRRRPGPLLNVLCTFNLRPVPKGNVKTNRMATPKWTYHKEWSFASNYFIFLENVFQF